MTRPDDPPGQAPHDADATSYAPWTEQDAERARDEAEFLEVRAQETLEAEDAEEVEEAMDVDEIEHIDVVEAIVLRTDAEERERAGSHAGYGPGLHGVFGAGTPLGEATGLRLRPRKRWVALLAGLLGGAVGAQSFYTGRVFRGLFQAGMTLSSWLLALVTLGLMVPFAQVVSVVVWVWGGVEGVRYFLERTGSYAVDALGGPLR